MDPKIYRMGCPVERFTTGRKSERGLRRFEYETTTTAGCLVEIPHSLRTDPNNGVQGFWLWASSNSKRGLKWGSGGGGEGSLKNLSKNILK